MDGKESQPTDNPTKISQREQRGIYQLINPGIIELDSGCMFSSKTSTIIGRLGPLVHTRPDTYAVFKPRMDTRSRSVKSRIGSKLQATTIDTNHTEKILEYVREHELISIVGIDEAHMFPRDLVQIIKELSNRGINSLIAMLDTNWRGEYFETYLAIHKLAHKSVKHNAVCSTPDCIVPATYTQKTLNGKPAPWSDVILAVGDKKVKGRPGEGYEPRCFNCFVPPVKPVEYIHAP